MPLTDKQIKALPHSAKQQWVADERGLRILLHPNGSKYWHFKYRFSGKQKTLSLGVYPEVTLKSARLKRDEIRLLIREGIDPSLKRKEAKMAEATNRFSYLAKDWWNNEKGPWSEDHASRVWKRLEDNAFQSLDQISIFEIKAQHILVVIRRIEERGSLDVAKRVLQAIRAIFRYGVQIEA